MLRRLLSQEMRGKPANPAYMLAQSLVRTILRVAFKMKVFPSGRVPDKGPLVVVANHESFLDGFVVAAVLTRRCPTFLSASYLFHRPLTGPFLRLLGALPVQGEKSNVGSLREAIRILEGSGTVVVFPEGGISSSQLFGGAVYLALKAQAPLIPLYIMGTKEALPPGKIWPTFSPVTVHVGRPLLPAELSADGARIGVAVAQGRQLLGQLLGQGGSPDRRAL